jgi:hypothetical protein
LKSELESWLSEALKCGSQGNVVIEAFGTPGVGKSYFCDDLFVRVTENNRSLSYHYIDGYGEKRFLRIISKLSIIFKSCWCRWGLFSMACRIVFGFSGLKFLIRIKLIFNFLLVFSVIQMRSKQGSPILLDQGIFQGLWSCCYYQLGSNGLKEVNSLRKLISQLIQSLDLKLLVIIYVSASKKVIVNGLQTRVIKGSSELNSLQMDHIERGICATSNIIDVINDVVNSHPKVKLIEVPR